MENRGVFGYVLEDENNEPVQGFTVVVYDVESIARDEPLGNATTASNGFFEIRYDPSAYGWLESEPDLTVRVYDPVKRLVYESQEYEDVTDELWFVTLRVPAADLRGWLVTLRSGEAQMRSPGNHAEILIDNKIAWKRLNDAAHEAQQSICHTQLYYDTPRVFTSFDPEEPCEGEIPIATRLENALLQANRQRGVEVKILINDIRSFGYPLDTADRLDELFETANEISPHTVEVRSAYTDYNNALHTKMLIVDGEKAYIIGSPFMQEYFDDVSHKIDDPRRGLLSKLTGNVIQVPVHDVNLYLEGPVVGHICETFNLLWQHPWPWLDTLSSDRSGARPTPKSPTVSSSSRQNISVQIARTLPGKTFDNIDDGELGILEAYQRAVCNAEDFVYLENQYFAEPLIADALALALEAKPQLQVIMVLNNAVDAPKYHKLQSKLLNYLQTRFSSRFGAFTLWTHEQLPDWEGDRIIRNYVHSKVGIVDDKWATVGSANLAGQELNYSQHLLLGNIYPMEWMITQHDVVTERAIEVNAVFLNGVDGQPPSTVPDELRRRLWAEHLGYNPDDNILKERPHHGWLQLWKDRAQQKFHSLNSIPTTLHQSRILEWNENEDPMEYLRFLGVTPVNLLSATFTVERSVRSFDLFTGNWVS